MSSQTETITAGTYVRIVGRPDSAYQVIEAKPRKREAQLGVGGRWFSFDELVVISADEFERSRAARVVAGHQHDVAFHAATFMHDIDGMMARLLRAAEEVERLKAAYTAGTLTDFAFARRALEAASGGFRDNDASSVLFGLENLLAARERLTEAEATLAALTDEA